MALIENLALTMTRAMLTRFLSACVKISSSNGSLYFYRFFFFDVFIMYITCVLAFGFSTARLNAQTNHPQSGKKCTDERKHGVYTLQYTFRLITDRNEDDDKL
jgi:hypothetical protein